VEYVIVFVEFFVSLLSQTFIQTNLVIQSNVSVKFVF